MLDTIYQTALTDILQTRDANQNINDVLVVDRSLQEKNESTVFGEKNMLSKSWMISIQKTYIIEGVQSTIKKS